MPATSKKASYSCPCDLASALEAEGQKRAQRYICNVPSTGPTPAKIMLVGEAPGQIEAEVGKPFIGPAGELLTELLREADIDRSCVFIANTVRCWPVSEADHKPRSKHIRSCAAFLDAEIRQVAPLVIGAIGGIALKRLTGISSVLKYCGKVIETEHGYVVPVVHPAAVLHKKDVSPSEAAALRTTIVEALSTIRKLGNGEKPPRPIATNYTFCDSLDKLRAVKAEILAQAKAIAFDIETKGLEDFWESQILCLSFAWATGRAAVIPFYKQHMAPAWSCAEELAEAWATAKAIFELPVPKIGLHAKFDIKRLAHVGIDVAHYRYDVGLIHSLLDQESSHKGDDLALAFTDMGDIHDESKPYVKMGDFSKMPTEILWRRNAKDSDLAFRLAAKFLPRLNAEKLAVVYKTIVIPVMKVLIKAELRGVYIDRIRLTQIGNVRRRRIKELVSALRANPHVKAIEKERSEIIARDAWDKWARKHTRKAKPKQLSLLDTGEAPIPLEGFKEYLDQRLAKKAQAIAFNFKSPIQKAKLICDRMQMPRIETHKSKKKKNKAIPSLDHEVLTKLLVQADASTAGFLSDLLELSKLEKQVSTFIDTPLKSLDPQSRLHMSYNQAAVRTGRLSSSGEERDEYKGKGLNLQTIPRKDEEYRKCFIPGPGFAFLYADLSQAELRVLAHFSADDSMIADFHRGVDIHRNVAATALGKPPESISDEERNRAKRTIFGLVYGSTAQGIAAQYGMQEAEAATLIRGVFQRYPKAERYIADLKTRARALGRAYNLFGRFRVIPGLDSTDKGTLASAERKAVNSPVQSTASDLTCMAMVRVDAMIVKHGFQAHVLMNTHDSILFEVAEAQVEPLAEILRTEMERVPPGFRVPMKADVQVGTSLSHHDLKPLSQYLTEHGGPAKLD